MLLADWQIRALCVGEFPLDAFLVSGEGKGITLQAPLVEPFSESVSGNGVISYGLDHAGYCLRLASEILAFKNVYGEVVDPKRFKEEGYAQRVFERYEATGAVIIPAHGYILGRSFEYLRVPRHLKGRCLGKSTYARAGILVNMTPLEPGWEGHLTIEISNCNPGPAKVYVGEGIAQMEWDVLSSYPQVDYAQKSGKYQAQRGVTPSIVC